MIWSIIQSLDMTGTPAWEGLRTAHMKPIPSIQTLSANPPLRASFTDIICESPDENAIASLVAEDFGIALVADADSLDHFRLERLHLTDINLQHTVYMAYLKSHYQIPAVKNFISFVRKEGTKL